MTDLQQFESKANRFSLPQSQTTIQGARMPLWNEILSARIPLPPCLVRLHLECPAPDAAAAGGAQPERLATFELAVSGGLPGGFSDAQLLAAAVPGADGTAATEGRGGPRLRVAYSLDRRHVEAVQRGLWPSDARYLGSSSRSGGGGGGGGGGLFAPFDGP